MAFSFFLNKSRKLRNIWWVAVFFLVLAAITLPFILLSQQYKFETTILYQAVIVIAASLICQLLRKEPLSDLFAVFNFSWIKTFLLCLFIAMLLMLIPGFMLLVSMMQKKCLGETAILEKRLQNHCENPVSITNSHNCVTMLPNLIILL